MMRCTRCQRSAGGEEGVEDFARGQALCRELDDFGLARHAAVAPMSVCLAGDSNQVRPERFQVRHAPHQPPGITGSMTTTRWLGPCGDSCELTVHHPIECFEEVSEAGCVTLESRQDLDDRLDRRDAMCGGLSTDPVVAGLTGDESDPRQRTQGGVESHHPSRLGPSAIDDQEGFRRVLQFLWCNRSLAREEECGARLRHDLRDARVFVEIDAPVQFAVREAEVGDAGGPDRDPGLARMLEKHDARRCFDRAQIRTPAGADRATATFTGGAWIRDGD